MTYNQKLLEKVQTDRFGTVQYTNNSSVAKTITKTDDLISIDIEDFIYNNGSFIGSVIAKKAIIKLINVNNKYNLGTENLVDKTITISTGAIIDKGLVTEEIVTNSWGDFVVTSVENDNPNQVCTVVAYDKTIYLNKQYVSDATYPSTIADIFESVCTQCNLTYSSSTFLNSDFVVADDQYAGKTCRQVMTDIAKMAMGFVSVDSAVLTIKQLGTSPVTNTINKNTYYSLEILPVSSPINKLSIGLSFVDGGDTSRQDNSSISTYGQNELKLSDIGFLYTSALRELAIDTMFAEISGVSYLPYTCTYLGYDNVRAGDMITVTDVYNNSYNTYIFNHKFVFDGGFDGSIETTALTKSANTYEVANNTVNTVKKSEISIDNNTNEISILSGQVDDLTPYIQTLTSDTGVITLTDTPDSTGAVSELKLNNFSLELLYPMSVANSDYDLYPYQYLYPPYYNVYHITFGDESDFSGSNTTISVYSPIPLQTLGAVSDEILIQNNILYVVQRLGYTGATLGELAEPITYNLGNAVVQTYDTNTYIKLFRFEPDISCTYLKKNDLTSIFSTNINTESSIKVAIDNITLTSDKISLEGYTSINGSFTFDTEGNFIIGDYVNAGKYNLLENSSALYGLADWTVSNGYNSNINPHFGVRAINNNYSEDININYFKDTLSGSYIDIVASSYETNKTEYAITKETSVDALTEYGISFKNIATPIGDEYEGEYASYNIFTVQLLESFSDTFSIDKTTTLFTTSELLSQTLQQKHKTFTTDEHTRKIKIKFICQANFAVHPSSNAWLRISDILIDTQITERPWTPNKNEEDYGSIQITRSDIKIFDNGNTEVLTKINKGGVQTNALTVEEDAYTQVNKKVLNTGDISNILTGTSTVKALSEAKGKELSDKHNNESWSTPTFLNGWVNYGGGFQTAGYYKHDNRVYLTGLVKSGTIGENIFVLPTGYRPTGTQLYVVNSNGSFGTVYVDGVGNVIPQIGNNAWVSLDGINFRTD